MASFIDVSNLTYCGKEGQEIFSKQIYSLDLRGYGIQLMDNVKGKEKIYDGTIGDMWQAYTCPFTPSGSVVLNESFIEAAPIKVNLEECYDKFWNIWLVEQTSISLDGGIPQTFFDWFFNDKLLTKMAREYQEIFWQGDTDHTGAKPYLAVTDGVQKKLNESTATKINGAAFTVDNIISQIEAAVMGAINLGATNEVDTEQYKVFLNYNDVKLLEVALGKDCGCNSSDSVFSNYTRTGNSISVMGFEVVPTMQARNTIIVGPANNLVLGFDTFDSHIEYKLIDMRETTGDNMFRVLAISNIGVGIVLPELFVYSRVA